MKGPKFRIVQFEMANPDTGNRFFIDWFIKKEIEKTFRFFIWKINYTSMEMVWDKFIDPATLAGTSNNYDHGYKTLVEAKNVIDRYKRNMTPQIHHV